MELILLAGGKGERLKPITDTRPKPLIPILGKPLIERILDLFRSKISRAVVVAEYKYDLIKKFVDEYSNRTGLEIELVRQGKELGTGHAVQIAYPHVKSDEAIIVYGDLFIEKDVVESILNSPRNSLVGVSVDDPWNYGVLVLSEDRVLKIIEKPEEKSLPSNIINAGVYRFSKEVLEYVNKIEVSDRGEYELTDLIEIATERGYEIKLVNSSKEHWRDIGRPWDLIDIHKKLLSELNTRIIKGKIDPGVHIEGPVYIGEGAVVKGSTYIEGPVYIDEEAIVGPNSYIRPYTYIGKRSRIGFSTEVKESVIFEDTKLPHLNYVGDSVICENVNFGAGTLVANLRFDEEPVKVTIKGVRVSSGRKKLGAFVGGYVKTGINTSILPGVKIGAYSIIYPGVVVGKDVDYATIVKSSLL
ncbi:MAG: bifunctional sugar-1-phosphate nucleotidylyltransferase/acetyltransferase [Sulfolobales archaeon]